MKRFLSSVLTTALLLTSAGSVFAADPAPASTEFVLTDGSHLVLTDNGYIDGIDGTVTAADLKANFEGTVDIAGKSGDDLVATDDIIGNYKALIYGDVNRDGKVNLSDISAMLQSIAGWNTDINFYAADVNKSGDTDLLDITKMLKKAADWDDISLGNVRWVFDNSKLTAEHEDPALDLYFNTNLIKTSRSNNTNTGYNAYKIKVARNETESCQFYIASKKDVEGLTVELSDFVHEYGEGTVESEIFIHYYVNMEVHTNMLHESPEEIIEVDQFVDPLLPLADSFEIKADKNQGFTISMTAGKDTPAGMYKAVLTVKDAEGNEVKTANVYTYVWDFTLPDTPYSKSSFGMGSGTIYGTLGKYDRKWYSGDDNQTVAEHYEFMLDHNISCYQLPYSITDSRADAVMSDPRVTSFEIGGYNLRFPDLDDWNQTMANWNKIQTNPVWAEKGHFYYVDEPCSSSGAQLMKQQHEFLTEKLGEDADFDIIMPFFNTSVEDATYIDMIEFIQPYVDIYVPRSDGFHANLAGLPYGRGPWTPRGIANVRGENLDRIMKLREDPEKELWWYVCIDPGMPYPNLFTVQQGNMNRVIWWQQFIFDTEGFLYWATQAEWDNFRRHNTIGLGDGCLKYLGIFFGYEANLSIGSYRLLQIRDGFDDFDYLKMAEELVGREDVMKVVSTLTTDILKVNEDPDVMDECRDAIAEIIIANQK